MKSILIILAFSVSTASFSKQADSTKVLMHLDSIVNSFPDRNCYNLKSLNGVADYILRNFKKYGDSTYYQEYLVQNNTYKNVITSFGPKNAKRLIVGAHYDVCGSQDGADDNASGVVGLLELARLLDTIDLNIRIDIVAYSLEEPPYFRTNSMGSYVHAKYLADNNIDVLGMVCLEMIGFYSDQKNSQEYPIKLLKPFYGNKGDYITIVRKFNADKISRIFTKMFKQNELIKTKSFAGPENLTGIDFSDHLNYWKLGFPAVMITNTGFYRNKNYHEETDTIETLDISRMSAVIQQLFLTIKDLDNRSHKSKSK